MISVNRLFCNGVLQRERLLHAVTKFPVNAAQGGLYFDAMDASPHVLIVDDDREIRDLLSRFLAKNSYRVSTAADGREMRKALSDWAIDLIILDLMLPGEDGLTLCRNLRADSNIPVIMLTARGEEVDRIVGLEMGADDYLAKPFNPRELVARIKAVLRRTGGAAGGLAGARRTENGLIFSFAGWTLDLDRRELTSADGVLVPLSGGEFGLLAAFAGYPQRVLSRDQLLDLARGREAQPFDRSIDVQVSRLRRKIEADPQHPALIKTVRGGGYMFA
jgi:two-component system OmpR family response regulator